MRLIDADEVKRFYEEEFPNLDNGVHWSRNDIICNLDNIPTAKAVTVEWIEKWMKYWARILPDWGAFEVCAAMLKDWEKENETN